MSALTWQLQVALARADPVSGSKADIVMAPAMELVAMSATELTATSGTHDAPHATDAPDATDAPVTAPGREHGRTTSSSALLSPASQNVAACAPKVAAAVEPEPVPLTAPKSLIAPPPESKRVTARDAMASCRPERAKTPVAEFGPAASTVSEHEAVLAPVPEQVVVTQPETPDVQDRAKLGPTRATSTPFVRSMTAATTRVGGVASTTKSSARASGAGEASAVETSSTAKAQPREGEQAKPTIEAPSMAATPHSRESGIAKEDTDKPVPEVTSALQEREMMSSQNVCGGAAAPLSTREASHGETSSASVADVPSKGIGTKGFPEKPGIVPSRAPPLANKAASTASRATIEPAMTATAAAPGGKSTVMSQSGKPSSKLEAAQKDKALDVSNAATPLGIEATLSSIGEELNHLLRPHLEVLSNSMNAMLFMHGDMEGPGYSTSDGLLSAKYKTWAEDPALLSTQTTGSKSPVSSSTDEMQITLIRYLNSQGGCEEKSFSEPPSSIALDTPREPLQDQVAPAMELDFAPLAAETAAVPMVSVAPTAYETFVDTASQPIESEMQFAPLQVSLQELEKMMTAIQNSHDGIESRSPLPGAPTAAGTDAAKTESVPLVSTHPAVDDLVEPPTYSATCSDVVGIGALTRANHDLPRGTVEEEAGNFGAGASLSPALVAALLALDGATQWPDFAPGPLNRSNYPIHHSMPGDGMSLAREVVDPRVHSNPLNGVLQISAQLDDVIRSVSHLSKSNDISPIAQEESRLNSLKPELMEGRINGLVSTSCVRRDQQKPTLTAPSMGSMPRLASVRSLEESIEADLQEAQTLDQFTQLPSCVELPNLAASACEKKKDSILQPETIPSGYPAMCRTRIDVASLPPAPVAPYSSPPSALPLPPSTWLSQPPKGWSQLQWVNLDEAHTRVHLDIDSVVSEVKRLAEAERKVDQKDAHAVDAAMHTGNLRESPRLARSTQNNDQADRHMPKSETPNLVTESSQQGSSATQPPEYAPLPLPAPPPIPPPMRALRQLPSNTFLAPSPSPALAKAHYPVGTTTPAVPPQLVCPTWRSKDPINLAIRASLDAPPETAAHPCACSPSVTQWRHVEPSILQKSPEREDEEALILWHSKLEANRRKAIDFRLNLAEFPSATLPAEHVQTPTLAQVRPAALSTEDASQRPITGKHSLSSALLPTSLSTACLPTSSAQSSVKIRHPLPNGKHRISIVEKAVHEPCDDRFFRNAGDEFAKRVASHRTSARFASPMPASSCSVRAPR